MRAITAVVALALCLVVVTTEAEAVSVTRRAGGGHHTGGHKKGFDIYLTRCVKAKTILMQKPVSSVQGGARVCYVSYGQKVQTLKGGKTMQVTVANMLMILREVSFTTADGIKRAGWIDRSQLVACTAIIDDHIAPVKSLPIPLLKQCPPPNVKAPAIQLGPLPPSAVAGTCGQLCGSAEGAKLACIAMYLSYDQGKTITPAQLVTYLQTKPQTHDGWWHRAYEWSGQIGYCELQMTFPLPPGTAGGNKPTVTWIDLRGTGFQTYEGLCTRLKKKHGVLLNVRGGDHWVIAKGCDGLGMFEVNDPYPAGGTIKPRVTIDFSEAVDFIIYEPI